MASQEILNEAKELKNICQRLELLAEQHPPLSEALVTICGTISSTAMLLEVLVATKLPGLSRPI
jgi:hypothetical protein